MTMATLVAAGDKPIIIVGGSGRAAQFVEDWVQLERKKTKQKSSAEEEILNEKQLETAERSIRADIAPTKNTTFEKANLMEPKPDWWDVSKFTGFLKVLGLHQQLQFFGIADVSVCSRPLAPSEASAAIPRQYAQPHVCRVCRQSRRA